ncbi:MAG: CopD family protein [Betaproteobacteria bacterium]|nr:CopD family protein [Betaproteobacteria bacterium]
MRNLLLLLHLAGIIVWIGGMFFAHFCLRPVAVAQLPPLQRLPLMAAVLGRFFRVVAVAVVFIVASGLLRLLDVGFAVAPRAWHAMMSGGLLMVVVFTYLYGICYPALRFAVAAANWPRAGQVLEHIRKGVVFNLALGALIVVIATLGV